jgi:DNA-3-methyladenine glycosylase
VYLNYGVHYLLNAIAGPVGRPGCVLIRALEPLLGLATMARRRRVARDSPRLATGPGNVARALGITLAEHGADLTAGRLTIEPPDRPRDFPIASGPRVGITRSAELRLRFWIAGNRFVSRPSGRGAHRRGRSRAATGLAASRRRGAGSPPRPVASGRRPAAH